jgi:hypothetical protein
MEASLRTTFCFIIFDKYSRDNEVNVLSQGIDHPFSEYFKSNAPKKLGGREYKKYSQLKGKALATYHLLEACREGRASPSSSRTNCKAAAAAAASAPLTSNMSL